MDVRVKVLNEKVMKQKKTEKLESAENYRQTLIRTYRQLEVKRMVSGRSMSGTAGGLEEVKLRLFLSLLDVPPSMTERHAVGQ